MTSSRLVWTCIFYLSFHVLAGQGVVAPFPASATLRETESRIRLDVVVNDKSGKPVSGLKQQDFAVFDGKQPQKILSFEAVMDATADREPVEIILVVDSVNTRFERVSYERDQIKRFLQRDGGKLVRPVSIAFFSDSGLNLEGTASRDGNALAAYLNQNEAALRSITRSQGFYGAEDRMQLSVRALQELTEFAAKRPGRKIVIFVSPGWATLSGPEVQLTQKDQVGIFKTIVALSNQLRESGITLYSVDPLGTADAGTVRTFYWETFLKGVRSPNQVLLGNLSLQVLASQSGGRVLNSGNDLVSEFDRCTRDANTYYTLSIDSRPADGPDDYHAIEVKIAGSRLKAQTRSGYYAEPLQPRTP
jgi:VWFA-related protein